MILWLNGTFGVGKTTTARNIATTTERWRLFDAELVGYMLRAYLDDVDAEDFQELDAWRRLVPSVAKEIITLTGAELLVVQTVLVERYWRELAEGMEREGLQVFHVLLDCEDSALRARIAGDEDDPGAADWRLSHLDEYRSARAWMIEAADLVVDTTRCDPVVVARGILQGLIEGTTP